MKITKSQLTQLIKEELAAVDIEEGMFDAIKNKLSPKRPEAAKAPRASRERNEHEKKAARQQGGADAYDFNRGMLEKPNRPNDEDYMAGWNSALQEGTNRMKITKSQLNKIIQEEVAKSLEEAGGHEGVTYWPFIGGKINKEEIQGALDHISDLKSKHKSYESAMNASTSNNTLDNILEMEKSFNHWEKGIAKRSMIGIKRDTPR